VTCDNDSHGSRRRRHVVIVCGKGVASPVWDGAVLPPYKKIDFGFQRSEFWCILCAFSAVYLKLVKSWLNGLNHVIS